MIQRERVRKYIKVLLFLMIQYGVICYLFANRQYLFTDEIFSIGLANSQNYTFVDPRKYNELYGKWFSADVFRDYLSFHSLSIKNVFINQARDVHPPLYYVLVNLFSFLLQGFDSIILPVIVINLVCLLGVDYCLYQYAKRVLSPKLAFIALMFWSFSAAGLSNIIFLRMYLLQTLEILLFILAHDDVNEIVATRRKLVGIALLTCIGGFTHYYFYVFVVIFGFIYGIVVLKKQGIRALISYWGALCAGGICALVIFPSCVRHLFGYRGSYAVKSLLSLLNVSKILLYGKWLNQSIFGGLFLIIFLILVAIFLICLYRGKSPKTLFKLQSQSVFVCASIAYLGMGVVAIQGSELKSLRYLYSVIPGIAVLFVYLCSSLLRFKYHEVLILAICVVCCVMSIRTYHIDWRYTDYNAQTRIDEMKGKDCIIIGNNIDWINCYQSILIYKDCNECRYLLEDDLEQLPELLFDRGVSEVLISFPVDTSSNNKSEKNMKKICDMFENSTCELLYDYSCSSYIYLLRY